MADDAQTVNETFSTILQALNGEVTRDEGETARSFLARLAEGLSEMPQAAYDELPKEVTDWYDAAAKALMTNDPIPNPEGFEPSDAPAEPKKRGRPKSATPKAAKAAKAASAPKAAAKAAPVPGSKSTANADRFPLTATLKGWVLEEPSLDIGTMRARLVALGVPDSDIKDSTLNTVKFDTLSTIKIAAAKGMLEYPLGEHPFPPYAGPSTVDEPVDAANKSDGKDFEPGAVGGAAPLPGKGNEAGAAAE